MSNPVAFTKTYLSLMSDYTFLSSIDSFDFRNKRVVIKTGYWKQLVVFIKGHFNYDEKKLGLLLSIIKSCFINRFAEVSATKLKAFMLNKLYNSFFDFKNLLFYTEFYLKNSNKLDKNKFIELRKLKYYEKKANKHRIYQQRRLERLQRETELQIDREVIEFMNEYEPPSDSDSNPYFSGEDTFSSNQDIESPLPSEIDSNENDEESNNANDSESSNSNNQYLESSSSLQQDLRSMSESEFALNYGQSKLDYRVNEMDVNPLQLDRHNSYTVIHDNIGSSSKPIYVASERIYADGRVEDLSDYANVEDSDHHVDLTGNQFNFREYLDSFKDFV